MEYIIKMIKKIINLLYRISGYTKKEISSRNNILRIFDDCYNYRDSIKNNYNIKIGNEVITIPWYTYPAIEYLLSIDLSEMDVFEYGCGNSTEFWSKVARKVISVEDNEEWYNKLISKSIKNSQIKLIKEKDSYVSSVKDIDADICVIDGSYRLSCSKAIQDREYIMVILNNSDWHTAARNTLDTYKCYVRIDFNGFGPKNSYTWTTSIYLNRKHIFRYKKIEPLGGLKKEIMNDVE